MYLKTMVMILILIITPIFLMGCANLEKWLKEDSAREIRFNALMAAIENEIIIEAAKHENIQDYANAILEFNANVGYYLTENNQINIDALDLIIEEQSLALAKKYNMDGLGRIIRFSWAFFKPEIQLAINQGVNQQEQIKYVRTWLDRIVKVAEKIKQQKT